MLDIGIGLQWQSDESTGCALFGLTVQALLWGQTWVELGGSQDFVFKPGVDQKLTVTGNLRWHHDIASSLR